MPGILQSVDVEVNLSGGQIDFPDVISVVDCEITRVFGAAGSTATVQVIFEELLSEEEKIAIRRSVPGATPDERFDLTDTAIRNMDQRDRNRALAQGIEDAPAKFRLPDAETFFSGNEIEITIDVSIVNQNPKETEEHDERIFTGTVTKVSENNERIVTFEAMDKRYQLNRNMVQLDLNEEGATSVAVARNLLENDQMGWRQIRDFQFDLNLDDREVRTNESWGMDNHETVYNVLQDLAYHESWALDIDKNNVLHITDFPEHSKYDGSSMPPIVDWESGDEDTEKDIIVESKYDESGLGIYTPMASTPNSEEPVEGVGSKITLNNVYSRSAVDKARVSEIVDRSMMLDSGIIHCLGDPKIEPYDEIKLDKNAVDGFSAISEGEYMVKEVTHIINNEEGYILELELGQNPRELIEEFAGNAGGVTFREWLDEIEESAEEEASSFSIGDAIGATIDTARAVGSALNPLS